jgi:hypothetical protein
VRRLSALVCAVVMALATRAPSTKVEIPAEVVQGLRNAVDRASLSLGTLVGALRNEADSAPSATVRGRTLTSFGRDHSLYGHISGGDAGDGAGWFPP